MLHKISVAVAILLLLLAGLLERLWTDYWGAAPALAAAAERIQKVPFNLGTWHGQPVEQDADVAAAAGYAGCTWRRYEESASGTVISLLLVCGRPGPVCVHTPNACYGGAGYEMVAEPVQSKVTGLASTRPAVFWQADFVKSARGGDERLRIFWAWHADKRWQAVDNPRLTFMNLPVLYKLYVVCQITPEDKARKTEACMEFMRCLLPELGNLLEPPAPIARAAYP